MKRFFLTFFIATFSLFAIQVNSLEKDPYTPALSNAKPKTEAKAAAASSESSISISMVTWGVVLAVGIGLLVGLLPSSTSSHAH